MRLEVSVAEPISSPEADARPPAPFHPQFTPVSLGRVGRQGVDALIRDTAQREAIRRSLQEAGRPLSVVEVLEPAPRDVPGLGVAPPGFMVKGSRPGA